MARVRIPGRLLDVISEVEVERIRRRWERRGTPLLRRVLEDERDRVKTYGERGLLEAPIFGVLWTVWQGAGEDSAAYASRVVAAALEDDSKGLTDYVPNVEQARQFAASGARRIVNSTRRRLLDLLNRATAAALEAEIDLLYDSEILGAAADWIGGQVVSATAWAQQAVTTRQADAYGAQVAKIWRTVGDDRVRPTHAAAAGQRRALDQAYTVGAALLMFPGDPSGPPGETINCRCFETYEVVDRAPRRGGLGRVPSLPTLRR